MADKSIADWYLRWQGFCETCCDSTNTEFCLHRAYVGWAVKARKKSRKGKSENKEKHLSMIYELLLWFRILNMRFEFFMPTFL